MRTILLIALLALLALPAPAMATHGGTQRCSTSTFPDVQATFGTVCIPAQSTAWHKYEVAAGIFWARQSPSSPRTVQLGGDPFCCEGDSGASGYAIPHWCRAAYPYFWFPHGVTVHEEKFGPSHTLKVGQPPFGSSDANGTGGYCTIYIMTSYFYAGPSNEKCQMYIHEYGHMLGWGHHGTLPSTTPGRRMMDTSWIGFVDQATTICRENGMSG